MFISDDQFKTVERWVSNYSNEELARQVTMFEEMWNADSIVDFILLDEITLIREILRDECVKRFASASVEGESEG